MIYFPALMMMYVIIIKFARFKALFYTKSGCVFNRAMPGVGSVADGTIVQDKVSYMTPSNSYKAQLSTMFFNV